MTKAIDDVGGETSGFRLTTGENQFYGKPIERLFGQVQVNGILFYYGNQHNLIVASGSWQTEIPVVDCAFYLGAREQSDTIINLRRIWVNGSLILDWTNGNTGYVGDSTIKFRFYDGSEDQMPDPALVAHFGFEKVPAFRGMMYIVLTRLPITPGIMPTVLVEIIQSPKDVVEIYPITATDPTDAIPYASVYADWKSNYVLCPVLDGTSGEFYSLFSLNPDNPVGFTAKIKSDGSPTLRRAMAFSNYSPPNFWTQDGGLSNRSRLCYVEGATGSVIARWGTPGATPGSSMVNGFAFMHDMATTRCQVTFGYEYHVGITYFNEVTVARLTNEGIIEPCHIYSGAETEFSGTVHMVVRADPLVDGIPYNGYGMVYIAVGRSIYRAYIVSPEKTDDTFVEGSYDPQLPGGVDVCAVASYSGGFHYRGSRLDKLFTFPAGVEPRFVCVGPRNRQWVSVITHDSNTSKTHLRVFDTQYSQLDRAAALDLDYFALVREVELPYTNMSASAFKYQRKSEMTNDYSFSYVTGAQFNLVTVSMETGQVRTQPGNTTYVDENGTPYAVGDFYYRNRGFTDRRNGRHFYIQQDTAVISYPGWANYGMITTSATSLATILRQYCIAAGYDNSDIITDGIEYWVTGSRINENVKLTDLLDAVCEIYQITYFETNGKIKFVRQSQIAEGATFAAELSENQLVPLNTSADDGAIITTTKRMAQDNPNIVTLNYIDGISGYLIATQSVKRTNYPVKTSKSYLTRSIDVPLILSAGDASYRASRALFSMWNSQLTHEFLVTYEHMALEPGDYVKLTARDGKVYPVLIREATINGDMSLSLRGTTISQFVDFPPPNEPAYSPPRDTIPKARPMLPFNVDNVLISPSDETTPNASAPLYYSSTGSGNFFVDTINIGFTIGPKWGFATTLPDIPPWQPDDTSEIMLIETYPGALAGITGCTNDEFLSGKNVLLVGSLGAWECIYFRDVTANDDGSYTLTHIARGMRGTDIMMAGNANGGVAVVFDRMRVGHTDTFGRMLNSIIQTWHIQTGMAPSNRALAQAIPYRANSIRLWAPVKVECVWSSGDVLVTWTRRTRWETELHDGDADTPLEEETESYQIEILDGTNVKRTEIVSSPDFTYTAAMQSDDSMTITNTLKVRIRQISAITGIGWPREGTYNVE